MSDLILSPVRPHTKEITGQVFGRLTVISFAGKDRHGNHYWLCRCSCGKESTVAKGALKVGNTTSCGCLHNEIAAKQKMTHGMNGSPEHLTWFSMKGRCYNKNDSDCYPLYGGRGIKVCDRWLHSFENFYADMGPKPSPKHSIDRFPNNDGNYEPGNCRWATLVEQNNNTRFNVRLELHGEVLTIAQWARRAVVSPTTFRSRLRLGWPLEKALTIPSSKQKDKKGRWVSVAKDYAHGSSAHQNNGSPSASPSRTQ